MTEPPRDPPIVEQEWISGPKVVDIGDLRVARGMTRRPQSSCPHRAMRYDTHERRIWCADCETDVHPFDAFLVVCHYFEGAQAKIARDRKEVDEALQHNMIRIAAKKMDEHFRRKNMVPGCPHCGAGILPEDVARMPLIGREWEVARRQRRKQT